MLQESLLYWSLCLSDVALCTNGTIQFVNDILNRALQISSTSTGSSQGIREMLENDYPTHTIEKSKKRAIERSRKQQHRKKNDHRDGILRLPYISDEVSRKVRKIVQKSGSNVHIAQRSGPTLRSILTRSALEPPQCPNKGRCIACQAGLEGRELHRRDKETSTRETLGAPEGSSKQG